MTSSTSSTPKGQMDWTRGPEVLWMKWLSPTPEDATALALNLQETLRGATKMRHSLLQFLGWDVRWEVLSRGCRVWLVLWAEPADT